MDHDVHDHTDLVARWGRHQRRGLFGGEVVGEFLRFACHGKDRFGGFPQGAYDCGRSVKTLTPKGVDAIQQRLRGMSPPQMLIPTVAEDITLRK